MRACFERLAAAVLREADPLCAAVVGITIDGKTKKSPLGGIVVDERRRSETLVAVQHTTTAAKSVAPKWLSTLKQSNQRTLLARVVRKTNRSDRPLFLPAT